jgi:hypothetical protein
MVANKIGIELAVQWNYNLIVMKTMPIEICDGVLRLPDETRLPPKSHLAVIVIDDQDAVSEFHKMAEAGGAFDFLREEPDLYSDADVLPGRRNPHFGDKQ